jgi:hypothetical protein
VCEHRHTTLGLGEEVVEREARPRHQDLLARFAERPDDECDHLGLAGAADDLVRLVAVLLGDLLA